MSKNYKYNDIEIKRALITWRSIVNNGPQIDIDEERIPMTNDDYQWIINNFIDITNGLDRTYFYTFHGVYPPSFDNNISHSQVKSDMNASLNARLVHYYKLRQIMKYNNNLQLIKECNQHILVTLTQIQPEPHIVINWKI